MRPEPVTFATRREATGATMRKVNTKSLRSEPPWSALLRNAPPYVSVPHRLIDGYPQFANSSQIPQSPQASAILTPSTNISDADRDVFASESRDIGQDLWKNHECSTYWAPFCKVSFTSDTSTQAKSL